ncbi:uncharacterized protein LOC128253183 isoform X1 [Drosophila gunungcola]|uniref:uncharacterized protein LOC128253183 isoform X1 n=1 Tax=Drosophila gunungcola TaxID=103775 RepID=UPI0022E12F66|nr:uncharacterized protein LOC128253183 isoform X1 [Drosophila gunungcola]
MVLMESYLFCASVRLGVLVICTAAALKSTLIMWLIFSDGTSFLFGLFRILETHYKTSTIIKESATWVEQSFVILVLAYWQPMEHTSSKSTTLFPWRCWSSFTQSK